MAKKVLVFLVVLSMLLAIGCEGNANENNQSDNNTTNNEVSNSEEMMTEEERLAKSNAAMKNGNVLFVGSDDFDEEFNPIYAQKDSDKEVVEYVFDGLVRIDEEGKAVDNLATYEISDDKLTYTFKLKENIKFSDGTPLTAEDVLFTYKLLAHPDYDGSKGNIIEDIYGSKSYRQGESEEIEGIEVIDPLTISFKLKNPKVDKINDFCLGILSKEYYGFENFSEIKEKNLSPMGTGKMILKEYVKKDYISFETNKDYFLGNIKIDGIKLIVRPEEKASEMLEKGELDISKVTANPDHYGKILASEIINVDDYNDNSYRYIGLNLRLDKFKDKHVRQALWYGLNIDEFVNNQWGEFASQVYVPFMPGSYAYPNMDEINTYSYDVIKAKELLKEAGWEDTDNDGILDKNGEKFEIVWASFDNSGWTSNLIELAKKNYKLLGIELKEEMYDFNSLTDKVFEKQDFEVYNMGWELHIDPDQSIIFSSDSDILGGYNAVGFRNVRADEIFGLINKDYEYSSKKLLYNELAKIINDEVPYIFLTMGKHIVGINTRVKNVDIDTYKTLSSQILDIELEYINE